MNYVSLLSRLPYNMSNMPFEIQLKMAQCESGKILSSSLIISFSSPFFHLSFLSLSCDPSLFLSLTLSSFSDPSFYSLLPILSPWSFSTSCTIAKLKYLISLDFIITVIFWCKYCHYLQDKHILGYWRLNHLSYGGCART